MGIMQEDWLNFWFKPQLFIHRTWIDEIDKRLLNKNSSSLTWHLSYGYICSLFRLPKVYQELDDGIARNILQLLLQKDETVIDVATMMISGVSNNKSMPLNFRRKILQRSRGLSLKKRFLNNSDDLSVSEYGIYFVYLAVEFLTPTLWRRVRLIFPRATVENIEEAGKQVYRSEVNEKAVRRAWRYILNFISEIKSEIESKPGITFHEENPSC